jgi:photosystem II stability/assembly factor-like uncharacterized protein
MAGRLLCGSRKGLVTFRRGADGWALDAVHFPGIPVEYAMRDPRDGALWAGLDHGHWGPKLHRSRDDGATWEEIPPPAFPDGAQIRDAWSGRVDEAVLENLWTLMPGGADQPGRLYIGTNPGGLFRSDDGGDTWSLVRGLWDHPSRLGEEGGRPGWFGGGRDTPGVHSICVDPRDSRRVFVGISCGGVFETTDDGETWAPRNAGLPAPGMPEGEHETGHDPHHVLQVAGTPDVIWQQNHMGVYRSTDAGRTWTDVSERDGPVGFGFPVAVDPDDPLRAWVVPANGDQGRTAVGGRLLVCRTDDGGRTWRQLTAGLPQVAAFDLVYRHALDHASGRLAFGSTTGNLFLSEDGGDTWATLSHHLPPIYSVRFAAG